MREGGVGDSLCAFCVYSSQLPLYREAWALRAQGKLAGTTGLPGGASPAGRLIDPRGPLDKRVQSRSECLVQIVWSGARDAKLAPAPAP